ncbi:alkaline shock response membrane anchor protein AmaP [Corynebacterium kalidii]|uniref:Alkaline shock response membrane anchor protein AmaP n=1 Tax=Corynebacterium kalidii TaxID=2931982 RepID=A0A9X1WG26_9CORY|nr:alkaline shock response membrane anchor protein AmaP [Corynebacterium kalidii]MCJ7857811.1 alkaline shock response membrane anchor protein AmaP [Corynebacterium kalidii]
MNRGKAFVDRVVTFLLFLVFGGAAFWMIGSHLDLPAARRIGDYVDSDFWAELGSRDNYNTILIVAATVAALAGLLLIGINIERKRLGRTASPASAPTGTIRTSPADIASAVAQTFEKRDDVRSARHRATEDRGTDIIEIRLRITAEADIAALTDSCHRAAADITDALPGQNILPRFVLQAEQPVRSR